MNNQIFIKATLAVAFIFSVSSLFSQDTELENNPFEVFKDYKRIGFNVSPRLYLKAKVNRTFGAIDYKQKNGFGGSFGLDYVIRPAHRWSFRTGAHFNKLVVNKSTFFIAENDLPVDFSIKENLYSTSFLVFSIPAEVEYKHPLKQDLFLSLRGGLNFMFQEEGSYGISFSAPSNENQELTFFEFEAFSKEKKINPNLKFSPGVYFIHNKFMLQTSLIYQKNVSNVLEGNYRFFNLEQSEDSGGTYKMSGDYIGLEFVLFLKKTRAKNK